MPLLDDEDRLLRERAISALKRSASRDAEDVCATFDVPLGLFLDMREVTMTVLANEHRRCSSKNQFLAPADRHALADRVHEMIVHVPDAHRLDVYLRANLGLAEVLVMEADPTDEQFQALETLIALMG